MCGFRKAFERISPMFQNHFHSIKNMLLNPWSFSMKHFFDAYRLKTSLSKNIFKRAKEVMPEESPITFTIFRLTLFLLKMQRVQKSGMWMEMSI